VKELKIFDSTTKKISDGDRNAVVCLGFFDGVHKGHARLIRRAIDLAKEKKVKAMVYTFDISPKNFGGQIQVQEITPLRVKARILEAFGIDAMYVERFDEEFKNLTAREFVKRVIAQKLGAGHLVIGYNYQFGKNALSGYEELKKYCAPFGVDVTRMPRFSLAGQPVSSTLIRSMLLGGQVDQAANLMGRYFYVVDKVIRGQQVGSILNVKTINQEFTRNTIIPAKGVYISRTAADGGIYQSMTNVGTRPTVNISDDIRLETHMLGFDAEIYGKEVKVEFLKRIRDEKRFDSLEELKLQLSRDTARTLEFFEKNAQKIDVL
jgi:riboflavin kinase/FMN adenylyltransferase